MSQAASQNAQPSNAATSPFLKNCWYVAALSTEINDEDLFRRKILNTSVLIYRKQNGQVVALHDRCPHRFVPLSIGTRNGDEITCHYHGLRFDCTGKCVHSPHGNGAIPKAAVVRNFPIVERDGFLWIWMGDAEQADESKILDCSKLTNSPKDAVFYFVLHNEANYELITDNIMDLTHIDHLHGPLINTKGKLSPLRPNVSEDGEDIHIRWDWKADPAMPLLGTHLPEPEAKCDQFLTVKWHAPSNMHLQVGALQEGEDYHEDGVVLYDFHLMTPETERSTHYFFGSARNYKQDDPEYNEMHKMGLKAAFEEEDKPVIDLQQEEIETTDLFSLNPVLLSSDAGNVRVRRRLQQMIANEQTV